MIFFPIFVMTFLVLEVTNIIRVYETLSWTAEYAVRQASEGVYTGGRRFSSDDLRTKIRDKLRDDLPIGGKYIDNRDVLCLVYFRANETPSDSDYSCVGSFTDEGSFGPGDIVSVTVRLHYEPMFSGLFKWMFPDEVLTMSATFDRVISAEM